MRKSARERAEAQFAEIQKTSDLALEERERDRQKTAEKMARLRALRLAKEASDRDAAGSVDDDGTGERIKSP